jgi:hypothetical protein
MPEDGFVTVDNILGDAGAERAGKNIPDAPGEFTRTQSGVIEGDLVSWADASEWAGPHCTIHLVDIRKTLIGSHAAVLTGSIGKNQDAF